ncbi:MAG: FAD-binding oxidoreductase [Rhizobiaceae bacterium]|nr:FAD-binding oxidoreductase [Rhizobiaceae bacterium]
MTGPTGTEPTVAHPDLPEIGILIIGGGIVGSCLAGFLAKEGLDVAVVDSGWAGGTTANAGSLHVQMQSIFLQRFPHLVHRLEASLGLYKSAAAYWSDFQKELGADCEVKVNGGLMIAENQEQLDFLAKKAKREAELGLEVDVLDRASLDRIAPYLGPAVIGAELCAHEGKVNPLLANKAIRAWGKTHGAVRLAEERVLQLTADKAGFRATTARGQIKAGKVVLAAGYESMALAAQLGVHVPTRADPLHMNITEGTAPFITHLVQHANRPITLKQLGSGQAVIGGGWPAELGAPGRIPVVKLSSMVGNLSLAQHIIPQLSPLRVIRTWAGINTGVDGCGVIGAAPSVSGLYFAIPGDAGYTLGPLTARLAADCIQGRAPGEDISSCDPDRFTAI